MSSKIKKSAIYKTVPFKVKAYIYTAKRYRSISYCAHLSHLIIIYESVHIVLCVYVAEGITNRNCIIHTHTVYCVLAVKFTLNCILWDIYSRKVSNTLTLFMF